MVRCMYGELGRRAPRPSAASRTPRGLSCDRGGLEDHRMHVTTQRFEDRAQAGRQLAERLQSYAGRDDVLVLGLTRGGVAAASGLAQALDVPFDVLLVR